MLVVIVIAPNADNTGPDLDRIGKVEDIPDEIARTMLDLGTARTPTDEELAERKAGQSRYALGGEVNVVDSGSEVVSPSDTQAAAVSELPAEPGAAPSKK